MNLRRGAGERPLVIGHRGAAALAPENSLEALEAGIEAGADAVEFDVAPDLRLAHSSDGGGAGAPTLDEALAHLAAHDVGIHVDLKERGYERAVLDALRRHGLAERTFCSTVYAASTRTLLEAAPEVPRAIGYPRDRSGVSSLPWPEALTAAGAAALRFVVPLRIPPLLAVARADVLSLHHTLCSRAAVDAAHRRGAAVVGWTAKRPADVRRLAAAGVDAIVADDPAMARAAVEH